MNGHDDIKKDYGDEMHVFIEIFDKNQTHIDSIVAFKKLYKNVDSATKKILNKYKLNKIKVQKLPPSVCLRLNSNFHSLGI